MMKKRMSKLVHEGDYAAEVDVELIYTNDEWSPYLSLSDAEKLDAVRLALRRRDLQVANTLARVFESFRWRLDCLTSNRLLSRGSNGQKCDPMTQEQREYEEAVALLDFLIDEVGEDELHPLASLMEVLGVLIEKYEDDHIPEITAL